MTHSYTYFLSLVFPRTAGLFPPLTDIHRHLWELSHRDSSSIGGSRVIMTAALTAALALTGNWRGFSQSCSARKEWHSTTLTPSKRFSSLPSGEQGTSCPGPHTITHTNVWMNSVSNLFDSHGFLSHIIQTNISFFLIWSAIVYW